MEKLKPLNVIAMGSPGVATAAAQAGLPKQEVSQIAALFELKTLHNKLTALPQDKAYTQYQALPKETRSALASMFSPKYSEKDKNFFGKILDSAKSAVFYGGGTAVDIAKQVLGIATNPIPALVKAAGAATATTATELTPEPVKQGVGKVLETLVRPQEKLIKQPYAAIRAQAEAEGFSPVDAGKFIAKGFEELLPGGEDAVVADNSTNFMQYWERASDRENLYDDSEIAKLYKELTPAQSYVGKLLASKQDLVDNYEQFQDNPQVVDLINRYVSGDEDAMKEVGYAVARFEKSKISPGRDVARSLVSLFPHEYEKAMLGDGNAAKFFNTVSGGIDLTVTVGLDPLLLAGKAKRSLDVARLGFFKVGEGAIPLETAFSRTTVRRYWDNAGKLIDTYRNGNLAQKAQALNRLQDRYREININVVEDLANAGVKNADDALDYFVNGQRFVNMMAGGVGFAGKTTLIPRTTMMRSMSDGIKNLANKTLGTERYSSMDVPETIADFSVKFSDDPIVWADKIGAEKAAIGFTAKDKTTLAKIDRVVRQFAIAPKNDRIISISDGSSANQIFALARTVVDKTTAGSFRAAWIGGDEGQRLLMLKGLLKTLGHGMGLNLSEEGRALLANIDEMSKEIYSVSQSSVDIGDLADVLKVAKASGASNPTGVRALVQDAITSTSAEGKTSRLLASVNAKLAEYASQVKTLRALRNEAKAKGDDALVATLSDELKIVGAKYGRELKTKKALKRQTDTAEDAPIEDLSDIEVMNLDRFNAGQTLDGTPRAIRLYQLSDYRSLPNFTEWREVAARAGVLSETFGKATNSVINKRITDGWSFSNLYPRLGVRTTVEEVGTFGLIGGAEGFGNYLKARLVSRELRAATPAGVKTTIFNNAKETNNLGFIYDKLFQITKKHYTKEQLLAMADDPELMASAVANAMIRNRFSPAFWLTKDSKEIGEYAADFARFDGKKIMDDINGSSVRAERMVSQSEEIASSLNQFGPSVALNVQNQEALLGMRFAPEFTEISYTNDKFVFNWLLELNNTVGKRNGQFGNIVLWNVGKQQDVVIKKLVDYIEGDGNDLARKFAIYSEQGAEGLARNIYLDATYALRDYSGRINMELVNSIRSKGGMEKFSLEDLTKLDKPYARPETILGQEIIPLGGANAEQVMYRIINSGYGWVGKQIALLDREPITLANYFMFRKELKGTQEAVKKNYMDNGLSAEGADSIAKFTVHETALDMARNRTLGFVDNGDVRTNLAYSLRTLGRYYRATEDFYRRLGRLTKYEKRAFVRLAILNQSFENSGFIHKDNNGQQYFTYPGDDILNSVLGRTLDMLGIQTYQPLPVRFGGYMKMLTPSLDPESSLPRLSNPFVSVVLDALTNLPYVGNYLRGVEKTLTGSYNVDVPAWEKAAPANIKRVYNLLAGTPENTESRFSSVVKAMRLLVSTGNGPTNPSEIDNFLYNSSVQARNIDLGKLVMGLGAPASIQTFANVDVPKELLSAGAFTWDTEFQKFLKKYDGDPQAFQKALVGFSKLYPSKLAYTISATDSDTQADFRKSIQAAEFVRNNKDLMMDHREGGAFFIPISGAGDLESYAFLKRQGFVKNKNLETFLRQVATASARQSYFTMNDDYNERIAAATSPTVKRVLRDELANRKKGMLAVYPLLQKSISPGSSGKADLTEALGDLRLLLSEGRAPDKKLGDIFSAMISEYDRTQVLIQQNSGSRTIQELRRKEAKEDLRDILVKLSSTNENAAALFNIILDPLIGE
jgi:hypothetical protein